MKGGCMRLSNLLLYLFLLAAPALTFAQEFPKAEIFGGYSYLHVDTQGLSATSNQICLQFAIVPCPVRVHSGANGWDASGQFNLNSWFGIKADVAGHYNTPVSVNFASASPLGTFNLNFSGPRQHTYDFLFGPALSYRRPRYTPFAHALLGDEHVSFGTIQLPLGLGTSPTPPSHDYFAFALGGGVDVKVTRHVWVRAGEFDYQFVNASGGNSGHQNDFRFSTGVVLALGVK
jgi:opacity protein-like surface antigen